MTLVVLCQLRIVHLIQHPMQKLMSVLLITKSPVSAPFAPHELRAAVRGSGSGIDKLVEQSYSTCEYRIVRLRGPVRLRKLVQTARNTGAFM
jgi:hypothetical protein